MNSTQSLNYLAQLDFNMVFRGLILYCFVIWFCIVVWVAKDISNRTRSLPLQLFCIFIVLFLTPLGIFIYLLIRPQKTLFEKIFEEEFLKLDTEYKKEIAAEKKVPAHPMDIQKTKTHHS
jgi:hypothetical protein